MSKYKIDNNNQCFSILDTEEKVFIGTTRYSMLRKITNTPEEIRELYRLSEIEHLAIKNYPIESNGHMDFNENRRDAFINALVSSDKKFTKNQMISAMEYAQSFTHSINGIRHYIDFCLELLPERFCDIELNDATHTVTILKIL